MNHAARIVLGEGAAVVAMTTIASLHGGQGFPRPAIFIAGAVAYGALALLAGPAPELAVTFGALGLVYGAVRASGKGGQSVGELVLGAITGIKSATFEPAGSGRTTQGGPAGGAGASGTNAGGGVGSEPYGPPSPGATRAGTGSGPVFGGGVPVASSDGGDPYASVARAQTAPLAQFTSIIGRPYEGTHTQYGNWESDNAVDLAAPNHTAVYAVAAGTIGPQIGSLGSSDPHLAGERLHLVTGGNEYYYQHLSSIVVHAGEQVRAGQLLGYTGATNHLHFAAKNGSPLQILGLT